MAIDETLFTDQETTLVVPKRHWRVVLFFMPVVAFFCAVLTVFILTKPPSSFVPPVAITIEPGTTVREITELLKEQSVVRSSTMLYFVLTALHEPENIKASTYVFETPLSTFAVAEKLVTGEFGNDLIKFTHYEGERVSEIADNAERELLNFDKARFLERAMPLEGRLYPETYHIPKTFTADELVDIMLETYNKQTANIRPKIESHSLTEDEILVLASILEREANSPESMGMVSDILQRRMQEGMPLQADASIEYILNKPLKELTPEDLEIDSPYNTYLNRGLPPTPIGNPGIEAITAVLEPISSNYVFYITDNDGNFHYAVTYDEHKANIAKYLR